MSYAKDLMNDIARNADFRELSDNELAHLKSVLLRCYLDIQSVCDRHGLRLMLGGGSCLGAVRHHGFIPWDDDLDALMPREDFEKLKEIFAEELGDRYILNAPNHGQDISYRFPVIRIKGTKETGSGGEEHELKIDIFLIENAPKNRLYRRIKGLYCHALMLIDSSVESCKNGEESIFFKTEEGRRFLRRRMRLGRLFSFRSVQQWRNSVDRACQYRKKTGIKTIPTGRKHYFGEMQPAETFVPVSRGMFEGREVNLPGDPHAYLVGLYGGDYMMPPPPEKREKHYIQKIDFGEN